MFASVEGAKLFDEELLFTIN